MTTRNVNKSLAGLEDLVTGKGVISQTRNKVATDITKIDVGLPVDTEVALSAIEVTEYTRARLYSSVTSYTDYIYDPDDLTGVASDTGPGTWIVVRLDYVNGRMQAVFPSKAAAAADISLAAGNRFSVEDGGTYKVIAGAVITPFKDFDLGGGLAAIWQEGVEALTSRKEDVEFKPEDNFYGGSTATVGGGVLILGDSNSQGYGAGGLPEESYRDGFAFKLIRSIYNSVDEGPAQDRGYRYGTNLSLASALTDAGVSTDGTVAAAGGVVDSYIALTENQSITITGREVVFCDVFYTAPTGGVLEFSLNGVVFDTKALTPGTGSAAIYSTFPTQINNDGSYIKSTDILNVKLITAGVTVNISGLETLRTSDANHSPYTIIAAKSGWAFNHFNVDTRAEGICAHMNLVRGVGKKILVVVALGTNDIYNPLHFNDPAGYIAELSNLIADYTLYLTGDAEFLIEIPPEGGSIISGPESGDPYLAFVSAIIEFCETNGHQMVRLDKSPVSGRDTYLQDNGVHFDSVGADIVAKEFCRTIGVPYNPYVHRLVDDGSDSAPAVVEASSQLEEDDAFAAGALAVVRLDLIAPDSSIFLDFENAGDVTVDTSRIAHQGTITGSVPSVASGAPVGSRAANFSAGYIKYPDHPSFDLTGNQWGVEGYMKLVDNTKTNMLVSKGADGDLNGAWYFGLLTAGGTNLKLAFTSQNNNVPMYVDYPHELDLTNYHHISFNCDGSNVNAYIDGELFATVPAQTMSGNSGPVLVGGHNNDAPAVGSASCLLDQVIISNTGPLRTNNFTPPTGV